MSEVKRYDCTNGKAQHCYGCYEMTESAEGDYVSSADYDAQRLRADTAEDESEDLRSRVTNVNSQLIAANWELSETREAYLNQSGRLVAAEQRISELEKDAARWNFFSTMANDLQAFPHSLGS